ncbi:hypothetical protein JYT44_00995 [Caldithrix abyssi]|nr:hypothetical protein [Caldithrix abyssi]
MFMLISCDSPSEIETPLSFENMEEAKNFDVTEAGTKIFRGNVAWTGLWKHYWNVYNSQGEKTPSPSVDFEREMVIAVFYGSGYSGCSNSIEVIEDIFNKSGKIEINIGSFSLEDLGLCRTLVYPLQMVIVERSDLPVVFKGEVPY